MNRVRRSHWPNLFIVGAGRAGTTSLAEYLGQHPDIFMSPVKEPFFFTDANPRLTRAVRDERRYLELFEGASTEKLLGEASISYFWDPSSPAAIRRARPDARILVILRDPIERAYSHYWHAFRNGEETRSFLEAVRDEVAGRYLPGVEPYLKRSLYGEPLQRYLDAFGERVYVLFLEEMARDVAGELRKVFTFLGVGPEFAERIHSTPQNAFALPRNPIIAKLLRSPHARRVMRAAVPQQARRRVERLLVKSGDKPPMAPEAMAHLNGFFDNDRIRLERLLNRRVPW
jgi:hypothetical protein